MKNEITFPVKYAVEVKDQSETPWRTWDDDFRFEKYAKLCALRIAGQYHAIRVVRITREQIA